MTVDQGNSVVFIGGEFGLIFKALLSIKFGKVQFNW